MNTEDICQGEEPLSIGTNRHLFSININHLNRKRLRDLPRGLRRWGILRESGAVTSVAPRNLADHVPLQPHYTQLDLSTATYQPIHSFEFWLQRHLACVQQHQLPRTVLHLRHPSPIAETTRHL